MKFRETLACLTLLPSIGSRAGSIVRRIVASRTSSKNPKKNAMFLVVT